MAVKDGSQRPVGYQADITALRHDYPNLGWTSFAGWARRTFRPGDPGSLMQQ